MTLTLLRYRRAFIGVALLAALLLAGCAAGRPGSAAPAGRIVQVSTINALMLGQFNGILPLRDLLCDGDLGLGTFDQLDGELILLDGRIYQGSADGSVREPDPSLTTPFAVVTRFGSPSPAALAPAKSLAELEARLDAALPEKNSFVAIRIEAEFSSLTMRSVPRQTPPFVPLAEVVKHQSLWTHGQVSGTLVGIRCPRWAGGINVPGYHWHFLSRDKRLGGHVIDCMISSGTLASRTCREWLVRLSPAAAIEKVDLNQDLSGDLERVERQRGK
jgi:acetolactate decarboxylase